jgi:hypothetical protein
VLPVPLAGDYQYLFLVRPFLFFAILFGAALVAYAIRFWYRRRRVQSLPVSKIRSAALGMVSVQGAAQPRDDMLKGPLSGAWCCWWHCTVVERIGKSEQIRLSISSPGFFYLEDDTGRILVDPERAALHCSLSQGSDWDRVGPLLSAWGVRPTPSLFGVSSVTITEARVPPETPIFVLGELEHREVHLEERRQRFIEHLRYVRSDPTQMAQADTNRDGIIDPQEWDAFRAKEEEQFLAEEAKRDTADSVILRAPERGGFVISIGSREQADRRLESNALWSLIGGLFLATTVGTYVRRQAMSPIFTISAVAAGLLAGFLLDLQEGNTFDDGEYKSPES